MSLGIMTRVTESNNLFSMGEKQLVCLARAMILKTRIIVLDEATANVDLKTDQFIQEQLHENFTANREATVLLIAHRLATVIDSDRICVMANGEAVEYDHPFKLLAHDGDDTEITNTEGHFA